MRTESQQNAVSRGPAVVWQLTRACSLRCPACHFGCSQHRVLGELSTYEAYKTIDAIAALKPRELVMTGGDPLEREDLCELIEYARHRDLDPVLVVSPSRFLVPQKMTLLKASGLRRMCFSLDGSRAEIHDSVRGVSGSYAATVGALRWAEKAGMTVEVNTLVLRRNKDDLTCLAQQLSEFGAHRWNVYFLVPIGNAEKLDALTAEEVEEVLQFLAECVRGAPFTAVTVEAPHYRRVLLQQRLDRMFREADEVRFLRPETEMAGSYIYITYRGEVWASEFLPLSAGNVRHRPLDEIYRRADLFVSLREKSLLKGKCGICEYRHVCGGSRARAWAMTGDIFAADPLCEYEPAMGASIALPVMREAS